MVVALIQTLQRFVKYLFCRTISQLFLCTHYCTEQDMQNNFRPFQVFHILLCFLKLIQLISFCQSANISPHGQSKNRYLEWFINVSSYRWSLGFYYNLTDSCLQGLTVDGACQSEKQAMSSREMSADLWDRIVPRGSLRDHFWSTESGQERVSLHHSQTEGVWIHQQSSQIWPAGQAEVQNPLVWSKIELCCRNFQQCVEKSRHWASPH